MVDYQELLVDLLLVRRLHPWHNNEGKRLGKTPEGRVPLSPDTDAIGLSELATLLQSDVTKSGTKDRLA